jgi:hypothetical protein
VIVIAGNVEDLGSRLRVLQQAAEHLAAPSKLIGPAVPRTAR